MTECLLSYSTYLKVMTGEIPCPKCGKWALKQRASDEHTKEALSRYSSPTPPQLIKENE